MCYQKFKSPNIEQFLENSHNLITMTKKQKTTTKQQQRRHRDKMDSKRDLIMKDDGQEYAQVVSKLGDSRLKLDCYDGIERTGRICGAMKKKVWIQVGELVLVSIRSFDDDKCDIIHRYTPTEAQDLKSRGSLPKTAKISALAVEIELAKVLPDLLSGPSLDDDAFEFI